MIQILQAPSSVLGCFVLALTLVFVFPDLRMDVRTPYVKIMATYFDHWGLVGQNLMKDLQIVLSKILYSI